MFPVVGTAKGRERQGSITNEASDGMSVQAEEEGDEKVMSVPESLE
jgi:hypothetical protein